MERVRERERERERGSEGESDRGREGERERGREGERESFREREEERGPGTVTHAHMSHMYILFQGRSSTRCTCLSGMHDNGDSGQTFPQII